MKSIKFEIQKHQFFWFYWFRIIKSLYNF